MYNYIHIYIYIYISYSNLDGVLSAVTPVAAHPRARNTVGFHNYNLRIFNSRVSNPSKLIVDVFLTRCRISMCQGLGPTKTRGNFGNRP